MVRPQYDFDWQGIVDERLDDPPVENMRHRLRWVLALFGLALAAIWARAVQLEVSDGEDFRRQAVQPVERPFAIAPFRGRILARDGTVLAEDRQCRAVTIQFRYLEDPSNPQWLARLARARLSGAERRNPDRVAAAQAALRGEIAAVHRRLAQRCGLSYGEWQGRMARIQRRVETLAARVDRQRRDRYQERREQVSLESVPGELSLGSIAAGLFAPPESLPPPPVVLAEQTAYHRVFDDPQSELVLEIERNPGAFPGVKIVEYARRHYPAGPLAAHLVGHVRPQATAHEESAPFEPDQTDSEPAGRMGAELRFEPLLRGQAGLEIRSTDRRGKLLATARVREPIAGQDVVLTLDPQLQAAAEQLLDRALRRLDRQAGRDGAWPHGAAIVVMDVHSGEILSAASAPRFDPNQFAAGDPRIEHDLSDPREPLFDRASKMAIPPGSTFKPLTALALVDRGLVDPQQPFRCQGYLEQPDRLRCELFGKHGIGHGDVALADALAQSCNVYFFHHARPLGARAMLDWAARFGFGERSGIELPDEAPGRLPSPSQLAQPGEISLFAVGQGAFTATPLQVVRMYAAIANGGRLLTPKLTRDRPVTRSTDSPGEISPSEPHIDVAPAALSAVREGLRRVVDDPQGTAFATVRVARVAIAGKTGTAQTGGDDHAWFAGYAPADAPRYALVVVFEHGGSGAAVAGPVAKALVERMQQGEYFGPAQTAERPIPPGKG